MLLNNKQNPEAALINLHYISVVIPCFNEERIIEETLNQTVRYLENKKYNFEIIVVDDGSKDKTRDKAGRIAKKNPMVQVIGYTRNRGKGYAIRKGVEKAGGWIILISDADLSTSIDQLARLLIYLEQGADIAIGSRAVQGSKILIYQPWYRNRAGQLFNKFLVLLGLTEFRDTQCGFKLFTGPAAKAIFSRLATNRWAYDVEALLIAKRLGYKIEEVPITWANSNNSKVGLLRDLPWTVFDLFRIWWRLRGDLRSPAKRKKSD
jgi:dolichyl-phosphate beta-glucosyltransferase